MPDRDADATFVFHRVRPRLQLARSVLLAVLALATPLVLAQDPQTPMPAQPAQQQPAADRPASQPTADQAQPEQPPTTEAPTPAATIGPEGPTELSADVIQARITEVEASKDLPEAVRVELLGLLRQTIESLRKVDSYQARTAEYRQGREQAPDQLKEWRAKLQEPIPPPTTADIPADAKSDFFSQKVTEAETALATKRASEQQVVDDERQRAARRTAIPNELTRLNGEIEKTQTDIAAAPPAGEDQRVTTARRNMLKAKRAALEAESNTYKEELRFYEARSETLTARRDVAQAERAAAEARAKFWREQLNAARQKEIEDQQKAAEQELANAPAAIRKLAEENAALAEQRATLNKKIENAQAKLPGVRDELRKLESDQRDFESQVATPGMTDIDFIGPRLRGARERLDRLQNAELDRERTRRNLATTQVEMARLRDSQQRLDIDEAVAEVMADIPEDSPRRTADEKRARDALANRRDALLALERDYEAYHTDLIDLYFAEDQLAKKVDSFSRLIDRYALWTRSVAPIHETRLPDDFQELRKAPWRVVNSLRLDVVESPVIAGLALAFFCALLVGRIVAVKRLPEIADRVGRARSDSFRLSVLALFDTIMLAAPVPFLLLLLGWRLSQATFESDAEGYAMTQAAGAGLFAAGLIAFPTLFFRHMCRTRGLGVVHFRWNRANATLLARHLRVATIVLPVGAFVASACNAMPDDNWNATIGRPAMCVMFLFGAFCAWRLLHPDHGAVALRLQRARAGWVYLSRYLWFPTLVLAPIGLTVASLIGYHYAASEIAYRIAISLVVLLAVSLFKSLAIRWLFIAQRRIALGRAEKKQAAAREREGEVSAEEIAAIEETELNLVTIGAQARQTLNSAIVLTMVLGLWGVWGAMLPALEFLDNITLWTYVTDAAAATGGADVVQTVQRVTLNSLLFSIIVLGATYVLSRNIPGLLEITILNRLPLDTGGRFAISALARYTIGVVGLLVGFMALGFQWSKLQWLVAALSVGLGFGLQEIVANFVSGLIILFERPIRVGDTVTVGDTSGTVTKIRIRATTVMDWDRKELIIPNKDLVTGQIVNWTLSDTVTRVIVPVGIAYGSDIALARKLLLEAADECPLLIEEPPPRALFRGFGDSTLNFDVRAYIRSLDDLLASQDALLTAIDEKFRKAKIEIAFPQRDLHIRSGLEPLLQAQAISRQAAPLSTPSE
ncbi:MAG: mechanosensitive ion channel [Phycisphaerales bacterium]|nr:mechanosensitive ion channel [Phycisphaerales bacterium]